MTLVRLATDLLRLLRKTLPTDVSFAAQMVVDHKSSIGCEIQILPLNSCTKFLFKANHELGRISAQVFPSDEDDTSLSAADDRYETQKDDGSDVTSDVNNNS